MTDVHRDTDSTTTRRTLLQAGAGGTGLAVLAACSSGSGNSPRRAPDSHSAGGGLVALADIEVGQAVSVTLSDGAPAVVARPSAKTAVCFTAVCTHQGCTVVPQGAKLICPCHGSQFNAMTGQVLLGPAPQALREIPVTVTNGEVVAKA